MVKSLIISIFTTLKKRVKLFKMDLFGFNDDITKINKIRKASRASKREAKANFKQQSRDLNCQDAVDNAGGLPAENEVQSFVSRGMSDAGSFLSVVLNKHGIIDEAIIATWTISRKNVDRLLLALDSGKIKHLTFLINDGLLKTNSTKAIYAYLCIEFDKRADKVKYNIANSHAKIQCYKSGDSYYTISGSANWSENPRIENFILIGGKQQYEFNKSWISLNMN